jgi:hypothetical protein
MTSGFAVGPLHAIRYTAKEVTVHFRWRYQDADGRDVPGPPMTFADQHEAESWFGDRWTELLSQGVQQVTLLHGEAEVYGPMSLHPADA